MANKEIRYMTLKKPKKKVIIIAKRKMEKLKLIQRIEMETHSGTMVSPIPILGSLCNL